MVRHPSEFWLGVQVQEVCQSGARKDASQNGPVEAPDAPKEMHAAALHLSLFVGATCVGRDHRR